MTSSLSYIVGHIQRSFRVLLRRVCAHDMEIPNLRYNAEGDLASLVNYRK